MTGFALTTPCLECPFRKTGGRPVRLRRGRVDEIHNVVTSHNGGAFPCHKTVDYENEDEDGEPITTGGEQWCAGALLYAFKQDSPNGLMRVAARLGVLDPEKLRGKRSVFRSWAEFRASALDADEEGDDREPCSVANAGCTAPAGYLDGNGITEGEDSAEYTCEACGMPVCGACSGSTGSGRICADCGEHGE